MAQRKKTKPNLYFIIWLNTNSKFRCCLLTFSSFPSLCRRPPAPPTWPGTRVCPPDALCTCDSPTHSYPTTHKVTTRVCPPDALCTCDSPTRSYPTTHKVTTRVCPPDALCTCDSPTHSYPTTHKVTTRVCPPDALCTCDSPTRSYPTTHPYKVTHLQHVT